jgi:hypothetical protein
LTQTPLRTPGISFAEVTASGFGFQSILRAVERCILMMAPALPRQYAFNYRGITEALWDLGSLLGGHLASSASGTIPPGATIGPGGLVINNSLVNGSLWFDERQGRLFIAIDNQWWQTNGAESLVHVGSMPPLSHDGTELRRQGQLWLCTRDGRLYLYVDDPQAQGEPGWYEISGGGGVSAPPQLELNDLLDVDDKIVDITAPDEVGLLMRDNSKPLHDPAAYAITDDLDFGTY